MAQRSVTVERPGPNADLEITVHVIYPNDHHAGEHITVLLEAPTGGVIAEAFTNSEGKAIFANVRPGLYVIRVRDQSIEETATGILNLENERKHHEYIRAEPRDGSNASLSPPAAKGKIPGKAQREFDKGTGFFSALPFPAEFVTASSRIPFGPACCAGCSQQDR